VFFSSRLAARALHDVDSLAAVEASKGVAFVLVTGALFGLWSYRSHARLDAARAEAARHRDALVASEKRIVAGVIAASVNHDLANLLMVANASAEELSAGALGGALGEDAAADLRASLDRMTELVRRARSASAPPREPCPVDVALAVREAAALARLHPALRRVDLECDIAEVGTMVCQPGAIARVVVNLLVNAGEALGGAGRVRLRLAADGDGARLTVEDDGPGFSAEALPRALEVSFTTKPTGTGLGLPSVLAAARSVGGGAQIGRSDALGGARVEVHFPRVDASA
jgi:signal transduction histidine kinase